MEKWKIVDYVCHGKYEVSDLGRIRKVSDHTLVYQHTNPNGYVQVNLWDNYEPKGKRQKHYYVHQIVAEAFCEKPDTNEKLEVDHINRNRADNVATNLRWVTRRENKDEESNRGLKSYDARKCYCVELDMEFKSSWQAAVYINSNMFGCKKKVSTLASMINDVCRGRRNKTCGMHFQFIREGSETIPTVE